MSHHVDIQLPEHCRNHLPGSRKSRNDWIVFQKQKIRSERRVSPYQHEIRDTFVRFFYKHNAGPPIGPDDDTTSRLISPPRPSMHTLGPSRRQRVFLSGTLTVTTKPAPSVVSSHPKHLASTLPPIPGENSPSGSAIRSTGANREPSSVSYPTCVPLKPQIDGDVLYLPNHAQDKPRRVLISPPKQTLYNVTRQGFVDAAGLYPLRRRHVVRAPISTREAVDDACLISASNRAVVVLAHARENDAVTLVGVGDDNLGTVVSLERPAKRGGVSAVTAMMQPHLFASGGHDHAVHLWDLNDDLSSASCCSLAIKHTSVVQSLMPIRDTSHKLLSAGADCSVHIWDLSSERVVNTLKTSNSVYHIHGTTSPFCTLLEVAHRELQFEVRDHRRVPINPVQRFGYHTSSLHGRYIRGKCDSSSGIFACGDRSGCIRFWDLRNPENPVATVSCFQDQKVVEVVFDQSHLIACLEDNQVAKIKTR